MFVLKHGYLSSIGMSYGYCYYYISDQFISDYTCVWLLMQAGGEAILSLQFKMPNFVRNVAGWNKIAAEARFLSITRWIRPGLPVSTTHLGTKGQCCRYPLMRTPAQVSILFIPSNPDSPSSPTNLLLGLAAFQMNKSEVNQDSASDIIPSFVSSPELDDSVVNTCPWKQVLVRNRTPCITGA